MVLGESVVKNNSDRSCRKLPAQICRFSGHVDSAKLDVLEVPFKTSVRLDNVMYFEDADVRLFCMSSSGIHPLQQVPGPCSSIEKYPCHWRSAFSASLMGVQNGEVGASSAFQNLKIMQQSAQILKVPVFATIQSRVMLHMMYRTFSSSLLSLEVL